MEEENNIHSPIVHSMKRDTVSGAQDVVGSHDVPADEALLLANMQSTNLKKRQMSVMAVLGILFLVIGILVFLLPGNFFVKKDTGIVVTKTKNQNFLGVDNTYNINLPKNETVDDFKKKSFSGTPGISEIIIKNEDQTIVPFLNLEPLLTKRFIENILPITTGEYLYGFFTDANSKSFPYFTFSVLDIQLIQKC
jgi:hypothetical protein